MARIEARKRLVEHRLANTEIRATVAGTVLDGAQERQENARVSQGDPIFEIGSLDSITFEIAIPADDRTHIATGQEVEIAIDGMGNRTFPGTVQLIRPRSEIRDDENSFVVEVEVENPSGQLQPGMEGTARIVTDPHSLGWNLFHRAAEKISTAIQL